MKYINQFTEFLKEGYGENTSINWELLNTARDLSLEDLDEGFSLKYQIYYKSPEESKSGINRFLAFEGGFSHDGDTFERNDIINNQISKTGFDINKHLSYFFWMSKQKNGQFINSYYYQDEKDRLFLIIDQLRAIYPSESIWVV